MRKLSYLHAFGVILFACLLTFVSCQREVDGNLPGTGTPGPTPDIDAVKVNAGIRGIVVDENNLPVKGANVSAGGQIAITDRYGVFRFNNVSLSKENGFVTVTKTGYFNGVRSFPATAGRTHNVRVQLIPKTNTGNFNAASGGSVTLSSGGKLLMPANAVVDASGNAYTGTVNVALTWINPTANNLPEIVIGDLRGITTSGEERGLQTFGMLGVEMTNAGGQPLKIAPGKKAELTFPIPASLSGNAPATIDLWHFDEAKARWIQEGTATKTGTNYIANVSHFSFWNCDAPFPLIDLCMTLVNAGNNQPLVNALVRIKRANGSYGSGYTDSLGNLCGKVPKHERLTLEVLDQCYSVVYTQNIGPFSANTSMGTISVTMNATNQLIVTGTLVDCSNANVTNGTVIIYTGGSHSYSVPVSNGTFSHTIIRCNNTALNLTILGIDNATSQQSAPLGATGTIGTINVGTIQACGTSSVQFANYLIDGVPYNFSAPPNQFICGDSVGSWGSYTRKTTFSGYSSAGNTTFGGFSLSFYNNQVAGTLPIVQGHMQWTASVQALSFVNSNPVVNVTAFGTAPGGFIEGNYSELMLVSGTPKLVDCVFRIRRN